MGTFSDQKICKDCPHRYAREEPFSGISVDVRSQHSLQESLAQFVKGLFFLLPGYFEDKAGSSLEVNYAFKMMQDFFNILL